MTQLPTSLPPLIALVGPTGVGKTALAVELARRFDGEVIGADSRQVYRFMDIGTAKPTPAERAAAPYHLIDMVEPDQSWTLAMYLDAARAVVEDITVRGKLPLLVGGTGQYVAAVLEGWQVPRVAPSWDLRNEWERIVAEQGVGVLYERLRAVDPVAATTIMPNNLRRIIRALEVHAITGKPISAQQTKQPPPYAITTLWLDLPREELYPRIDARVDAMVAAGLRQEVAGLLARGYDWTLPAMSSLGYQEWQPFFAGEASEAACIERLKFNTHNFVRKQTSWFKRLPALRRVAADADPLEHASTLIH